MYTFAQLLELSSHPATLTPPQMETKLLTYMFALCLRIDDYATDYSVLAQDLRMAPTK